MRPCDHTLPVSQPPAGGGGGGQDVRNAHSPNPAKLHLKSGGQQLGQKGLKVSCVVCVSVFDVSMQKMFVSTNFSIPAEIIEKLIAPNLDTAECEMSVTSKQPG